MVYDYGGWTMDITTIFMMTICKYSAFAYCYGDSEVKDLHESRKKHVIKQFSFLEYFSYIYFFPSCLMGPFFEFSDFIEFIELKGDYEEIPDTFYISFQRLLLGTFFSVVYLTLKNVGDVQNIIENPSKNPFMPYIAFLLLIVHKYKYYIAFCFADSAILSSGISYQKKNNEGNFDKIKNINVLKIETCSSVRVFFQNWNISVHNWLKKYVYFRIFSDIEIKTSKRKQNIANAVTFLVSAIWHGFYIGYYIVFFHFAIGIQIEESMNYLIKHFKFAQYKGSRIFIKYGFILGIYFDFCYSMGIMTSLSYERTAEFLSTVRYFFTIFEVTFLLFSILLIRIMTVLGYKIPSEDEDEMKKNN
jgi:lysophospholipid acyltransferase